MERGSEWSRIKELFEASLEREPSQRDAFLRDACGSDVEMRAEIESLLLAYQNAENLSRPFWLEQSLESTQEPKAIGAYRLIEKLGEGGMGTVWLAEQTAPVKRRVALKLIKSGMLASSALQRFRSERQSLAIMDHPAIAKVFDAGATPEGQPFFVMEYVPGVPITTYCDQKKLTIHERLELFIKVCEGVQHAHQKAIIHRDLKPANILVVELDGKALPRIIDFGLAKGVNPEVLGESQLTRVGSFLGTPGYMSPEQADPSVQDVDTRTDVYSLGVILYVLLTGWLPFEMERGRQQPLENTLRQLREDDPPRPSTKAGTRADSAKTAATARGTEPRQLVSLLRGDLDWITMTAVERERARRYATPTELANDIRRYLANEPVMARPANLSYRVQKYVRRHRIGVAAAGTIGALLVTFGVMQSIQLRKTTRERDRADRIAEFMTGMFKVSDPYESLATHVTAREVLDKAAHDIDTGLARDPELQGRLMHVMGMAYLNLGLYSRAQSLFERSVQLSTASLGPDNIQTLKTRQKLGWTLYQEGRLSEAESEQRSLAAVERRVFGSKNEETIGTLGDLATTLGEEGRLAEAEKVQRDVLEIQKRVLGAESRFTLISMNNLATLLLKQHRVEEAEKLQEDTLEIQRRVFGPENLTTIHYMMNVAEMKGEMGADDDAVKLSIQLLDLEHRVLGPDSPEAAETTYNLAILKAKHGQADEAFSLLRQAIDHGLLPRVALVMGDDPDLQPLHTDPRFSALVAHAKERAAPRTAD